MAATVIYRGFGEGLSGSIGSVLFSNAAYTIHLTADSDDIVDRVLTAGFPYFEVNGVAGAGSIEIAGIGIATFDNILGIVSFDQRSLDGLSFTAFMLDGSAGSLPFIGGIMDAWNLVSLYSQTTSFDMLLNDPMPTSVGELRITGHGADFTVTGGIVPEPSRTLSSLAGFGIWWLRRRRQS